MERNQFRDVTIVDGFVEKFVIRYSRSRNVTPVEVEDLGERILLLGRFGAARCVDEFVDLLVVFGHVTGAGAVRLHRITL